MSVTLQLEPETRLALKALENFRLVDLVSENRVDAHGWLDGHYWLFRGQNTSWTFEIGGSPTLSKPPIWWHGEPRGDQTVAAEAMSDQEAIAYILKVIEIFRSTDRAAPKPEDPGYADYILQAWSGGYISAAKVGEYLPLDILEVVELARQKGIPQPWTATFEVDRYIKKIKAQFGPLKR